MTLTETKGLKRGDIIYHVANRNSDGTPQQWRVAGAVKLWKRSPGRIRVPLKYGLHRHDALTEDTLHLLKTTAEAAT